MNHINNLARRSIDNNQRKMLISEKIYYKFFISVSVVCMTYVAVVVESQQKEITIITCCSTQCDMGKYISKNDFLNLMENLLPKYFFL